MIDQPRHRKIHKEPIPYLGGVAIFFGVLIGVLLSYGVGNVLTFKTIAIVLTFSALSVLGLVDDKVELRPKLKLLMQVIICALFATFAFRIETLHLPGALPFELGFLAIPVTVFWMVSIINAFNFIDGADGLAGIVGLTALLCTALLAIYCEDAAIANICLFGALATFAFLFYNWSPAKIYMGDCGSFGLGGLLSASMIAIERHGIDQPFNYQLPIMSAILAYPVLEITLSVLRRVLRGKPIGTADRGHIHHRLLHRGWSPAFVCYFATFFSVVTGSAALLTLANHRGLASWATAIAGVLFGMILHFSGFLDLFSTTSMRSSRPKFILMNHYASIQYLRLQTAQSVKDISALLESSCIELGVVAFTLRAEGNSPIEIQWEWSGIVQGPVLGLRYADDPMLLDSDTLMLNGVSAKWSFAVQPIEDEDFDVERRVTMNTLVQLASSQLLLISRAPVVQTVQTRNSSSVQRAEG